MPLELKELDERLRIAENELTEYRTRVSGMVEDVSEIRKHIDRVADESARHESLLKIDGKIDAAHKRIDSLTKDSMRITLEHDLCQKRATMDTIILETIKNDITSLKASVKTLVKDDEEVKGFFKTRVEKLIDIGLPALIVFSLLMAYLHFNGVSFTKDGKEEYSEMEQKQMRILEELVKGQQFLKENNIRRGDANTPNVIIEQPNKP